MELPLRILRDRPDHPVITVDGSLGATGLQLSHWPGNETPADLSHELSTGCALAFAQLPPAERRKRAAGARAIANNHYDTDGVCAAFAVRHPRAALANRERLLAAAAAGDFFQIPDMDALAIDAVIQGLADPARSPFASALAGLSDVMRHERALHLAVEHLPALLNGDLEPWRALWEETLEDTRADLADLRRSERRAIEDVDLTLWIGPYAARASRTSTQPLSPGRHAVFGSCRSDRTLVVTPAPDGWTWRLIVSTRSWFDLPNFEPPPRPDLMGLAERLNVLEGSAPEDTEAWRAHPKDHPSPELWFGGANHADFAEHATCLTPSTLDPLMVHAEIRATLWRSMGSPARRPGGSVAEAKRPALSADPR